jgi:hypothetical protein
MLQERPPPPMRVRSADMKVHDTATETLTSDAELLRHYETTRHVRFVERQDGSWDCQECDEMAVGPMAPGMDEDATRRPVPWMVDDRLS